VLPELAPGGGPEQAAGGSEQAASGGSEQAAGGGSDQAASGGSENAAGGAPERALFREARIRQRRRRLGGLAAFVIVCAATVVALVGLPGLSGRERAGGDRGIAAALARGSAAAAWVDNASRLRVGGVGTGGRVSSRAVAEVNAAPLPLVVARDRVYWVNPAGTFVPSLGHWSQVVMYLDLRTGRTGIAGPGQTVFLSADRRFLMTALPLNTLAEIPVAGGPARQFTLPAGWYLPGGYGLADLVDGQGLATAAGVLVQSRQGQGLGPRVLGLWRPGAHTVRVIGRSRGVVDAYTPPGGGYSLVAWLPVSCRPPGSCQIKITNTASMSVWTVRCPLRGGFALGGAFSPSGDELAVFATTRSRTSARLALIDTATGALRLTSRPALPIGMDIGWARWLPGGGRLIAGTSTGYLFDSATLEATPLVAAAASARAAGSLDVNYTTAVVPRWP